MICPEIRLVVSNVDIKTSFAAPRRQVYASKHFSTLYFAPLSSPLSLIQISLLSYPSTRGPKNADSQMLNPSKKLFFFITSTNSNIFS
jgi:hypothetical protein